MKITKMKNGNYEFWFSTGRKIPTKKDPSKLKYEYIHRSGFDTKKDAQKVYIELTQKYEAGGKTTKQTVRVFVEEWFPIFERQGRRGQALEMRTKDTYRWILENHILPYFGHMIVGSISAHDVKLFIDQQIRKGYANATVRDHYRLLKSLVQEITLRGYLPRNVVDDVRSPSIVKKSKAELNDQVLDHREQSILLQQADYELMYHQDYYTEFAHAYINLALNTGLRLSELLALKWGDVVTSTEKVEGKFVHILKVQRALNSDSSIKSTKTIAGERDIPLSPEIMDLLMTHRQRLEDHKATVSNWEENDFILPYKDGKANGTKRVPQQIRKLFDNAKLKGSSHTLRHTCITNWLHHVPNIKLVSTLAGHSTVALTLDRYGHILESNALSQIDNLYATMRSLKTKNYQR